MITNFSITIDLKASEKYKVAMLRGGGTMLTLAVGLYALDFRFLVKFVDITRKIDVFRVTIHEFLRFSFN